MWRIDRFCFPALFLISVCGFERTTEARIVFSGDRKQNNFVSVLLEAASLSKSSQALTFSCPSDGWIFVSWSCLGTGTAEVILDKKPLGHAGRGSRPEAMRYVSKGEHTVQVECQGKVTVDELVVKAIPELVHCGLGYNPEIKSYGLYDLAFLEADILPNVTTLIVPHNLALAENVIADWHRQGKKFIAEVGVNSQARTAEEHVNFWAGFCEQAPFLDGIIINEFIVNRPVVEWAELTPERLQRMDRERRQYEVYGEAIQRLRADARFKGRMLYTYVGGSGKKLNTEIVGTNFIPTIVASGYRVALERYLHEMSSPKGSQEALQLFIDGITDWEAKAPGVTRQMVIAFGLFSMPPGGLNKQPNVDYHVWMDQQMNVAAHHPAMSGLAGFNWWTSLLADEETVRFVGKLYRHYGIEGHTNRLTQDPLFLPHLQNGDFEKGTEGWTLQPAEEGSIAVTNFPRYGRIEGRFMGLGRPADPEHIGDTFLCMKRSARGPNRFSQTIRHLQPGRLYSLKMFSCDYDDLVNPKARKKEEVRHVAAVVLEGVEVDAKRSFSEVYSSNPEPKIPVCITYYWKVFRARSTEARLTVSDWQSEKEPGAPIGQQQTFNFLELQPYRE